MSNDMKKKTCVLTADDFVDLLEVAVSNIARLPQGKPTQPSIDDLRKEQDWAILRYELALEKHERVKEAMGTLRRAIGTLGREDTVSPLQLVKLRNPSPHPIQQAFQAGEHDLTHQVLWQAPSTREMERFTDIDLKLQGSGVRSNQWGEVEIDGYPIPGSNLGTSLRYLVKRSRGFMERFLLELENSGIYFGNKGSTFKVPRER